MARDPELDRLLKRLAFPDPQPVRMKMPRVIPDPQPVRMKMPRVIPGDAGPKYLRPKAVALRYSMSVPTVYRWLADGKIAGVTKPGMTLISVESVEQYLATWEQRGTVSRGPKAARVEKMHAG